ncbi:MAG: hypothetical protein OXF27_13835 [Acidobacteria bacterium]|nr:hypothetical protein [Acidobacteriota bacterium]
MRIGLHRARPRGSNAAGTASTDAGQGPPLDGRPDFSPAIGQWLGGGAGRWEGDTLVIESVRFNERGHYLWRNTWRASRSDLHLVERITRTGDETMDYEFTMTSDQASRGVTAGPMYGFACHEGNRGLLNMLRGARTQERGIGRSIRQRELLYFRRII